MKLLKLLLCQNSKPQIPPMPSWEEVIEIMYDKQLEYSYKEAVNVVYSQDRSRRYVILKSDNNCLTYRLEKIHQFDEEEWNYACSTGDKLPGIWEPYGGNAGVSIFNDNNELLNELRSETEYKQYFKVNTVCYECYETGDIIEKEANIVAQFVTAKKYNILYTEELPRFRKHPRNIYALPFTDKPSKIYNGVGRMGLDLADKRKKNLNNTQKEHIKNFLSDINYADKLMLRESEAIQYISIFEEANKFELIWVRNSGAEDEIPDGYEFIGYDISYPCEYCGSFSIICDCMFICRWHGCDEDGTLFLIDYNNLNVNGLFDEWQNAYDYMVKYLKEDWTERGEYYILEIYRKNDC